MKKLIVIALVTLGATAALAQTRMTSTAPAAGGLPLKQIDMEIDFLSRELDRLHRQIKQMEPTVNQMQSCQDAGMVYAPGAAGLGLGADGADADTVPDGCVPLTGTPLVSEIKATTGAATTGNINVATGNAFERLQAYINARGCPTAEGWHACSDDEVIFALDQRVAGANPPSLIIDGSTYWVTSLLPFRFNQTKASAAATSLNCSGWSSSTSSVAPFTIAGTIFDGNVNRPMFDFGSCATTRKVLCCR